MNSSLVWREAFWLCNEVNPRNKRFEELKLTTKPEPFHGPLRKKIKELQDVQSGERDMYPYIRDLLVNPKFGLGLRADQVVIDTALAGSKNAPDLRVYATKAGKVLRTGDHMVAVFEVKRGHDLQRTADAIFLEKKKYIQPGTRAFFFIDQGCVMRHQVISGAPQWYTKPWDEFITLHDFTEFFTDISSDRLQLEKQLDLFRLNLTPYAFNSVRELGRGPFIATIRDVSELLGNAVRSLIQTKVVPDLNEANLLIAEMTSRWGEPEYDWSLTERPIEFGNITDDESVRKMTDAEVADYEEAHDIFSFAIEPFLYALRIEKYLLVEYAERMGFKDAPSLLLSQKGSGSKLTESGRAVESFTYETASLILSRMLMVRFSEDNQFLDRCISNGGVEIFAKYADYYKKPMQALLLEAYRQSKDLYRSLFGQNILDWALQSADDRLSDALLHSMYLLSRWDFRTVHGDILSGVYDHYLEVSKRRALGEVFTRPEIARYMLNKCGYDSAKSVLDPACGTGTFLVEALSIEVSRLRSAGMLSEETVAPTLRRLHGLDISPFSVALAQIQILWHVIDLFTGKDPEQIRQLAAKIVPAIMVHGGHSSLDTFGRPLTEADVAGAQSGLDLSSEFASKRRKRNSRVSRRFRQICEDKYDIVIGNPPYVRSHRLSMEKQTQAAYSEVMEGPADLYIPFLYRSIVSWLKPAGRMALITPIPIIESTYADKLRAVLEHYKILEIVDFECLRKKTFHGVKRPTVVFIVEHSTPSADDKVEITTLYMDAYDPETDSLDFSKASHELLRRSELKQTAYLPHSSQLPFWALESFGNASESPLTTKLRAGDVELLCKFTNMPRLGGITQVAYSRRLKNGSIEVAAELPDRGAAQWSPYLMMAPGVQLGGAKALSATGWPIYKGQNIFASGLMGEPLGRWDPNSSKADQERILGYRSLFDNSRLFAIRNISQLPTACRVPLATGFQNTAHMVQLMEDFPLNLYLLSRVPQWYCAKLLRSNIVEDLTVTWSKKQLAMIPIPLERGPETIKALTDKGSAVLDADKDLANASRHVEALLSGVKKETLFTLFGANSQVTRGLDATELTSKPVLITEADVNGDYLSLGDIRLRIPNASLRTYLQWCLRMAVEKQPDATISIGAFGEIPVPANIIEVAQAIEAIGNNSPRQRFDEALNELDCVIGAAFHLSEADISYIQAQMIEDGFLKQLQPMYEHRGVRVQPYADHSDEDRYN